MKREIPPILVMGVQGSGKSTIGWMLAEKLGITFIDGDSLHPPANIAKMAAGVPLDDNDRMPWLMEIGRVLAAERHEGIIVACSALKRKYRDLLRESVPDLFIVDPEGPIELVASRISYRRHEFMPAALLQSQYATLEPRAQDERGVTVDISLDPAVVVESAAAALGVRSRATAG
jgi:carbohydrate kinase (thermoresistant glucokinase family)